MFRPLAVNVGFRYARSRRSFISFVSVVALTGLVLSVAVLLFVQAVVKGFERELETRVLAVLPHLTVYGRQPIENVGAIIDATRSIPGIRGAAPVVEGSALLSSGNKVAGVAIIGIDPPTYDDVSILSRFTRGGELTDLVAGGFRIALGAKVAKRLGLGVGDKATVVLPDAAVTPLGVFPRQKRFTVVAIIDTNTQLDQRSAYVNAADAARLFRIGDAVHAVQYAIDDLFEAREVGRRVLGAVGMEQFYASTWFRSYGNLYRAIQVQKGMMFLLLSLLVAVAAFNLVSTLVMVVNERRADVAILRTLGARSGLVVGTFVVLGSLIAAVGVGLGIAAGFGLGVVAEHGFPWLERTLGVSLMGEYLVQSLPVEFSAEDIWRVVATGFALCFVSTFYPAWRAARLPPAEVLQHE